MRVVIKVRKEGESGYFVEIETDDGIWQRKSATRSEAVAYFDGVMTGLVAVESLRESELFLDFEPGISIEDFAGLLNVSESKKMEKTAS